VSASQARPYDYLKRSLDVVASVFGVVLLSPLIGVMALLVAVKLGRPIIFAQPRPGLHGQLFTLYKFRTMSPLDPVRGSESDADRLTPFGRALRSTSLDELPSLWNVLRGDMSLVGPRPLLAAYLGRYTPEQARRHEVRPGVTGLAQVSGRNTLTWEQKFALDVEYVEKRTLLLDIRILLRTISAVFFREGVSSAGEATMSEFRG